MSEWGWVAFAFGVTYASMLTYASWSAQRLRTVRKKLEEWR